MEISRCDLQEELAKQSVLELEREGDDDGESVMLDLSLPSAKLPAFSRVADLLGELEAVVGDAWADVSHYLNMMSMAWLR